MQAKLGGRSQFVWGTYNNIWGYFFQDGGGHICTCGWFMSMYGKSHHNIIIILQLKLMFWEKKKNSFKLAAFIFIIYFFNFFF